MDNSLFVDLAISDNGVILCGTELLRPAAVDVKSWRALWDTAYKALERRGPMHALNDSIGSSMDIFRRMVAFNGAFE